MQEVIVYKKIAAYTPRAIRRQVQLVLREHLAIKTQQGARTQTTVGLRELRSACTAEKTKPETNKSPPPRFYAQSPVYIDANYVSILWMFDISFLNLLL